MDLLGRKRAAERARCCDVSGRALPRGKPVPGWWLRSELRPENLKGAGGHY